MTGIVNLCKPAGMSSHDAVNAVRRIIGIKRVGHGGTLDPGACGVLPMFLGWATRLVGYIEPRKAYRAEMTLGIATDTQDAAGETTAVNECAIKPSELGNAFAAFLGDSLQTPPMTSAIRIDGRHLYELARQGHTVQRPARPITIYSLHIRRIWPEDATILGTGTRVLFDVECSAGTYIRALCADIGEKLGCGAHMSFLVRTRAASCTLENAVTLEELTAAAQAGELDQLILPPDTVIEHLPMLTVGPADAERIITGQLFASDAATSEMPPETIWRVYDINDNLIALAGSTNTTGWLRPVRVFPLNREQAEDN